MDKSFNVIELSFIIRKLGIADNNSITCSKEKQRQLITNLINCFKGRIQSRLFMIESFDK